MDKLEEARRIIDEADTEIAKLFTTRMQAVEAVAAYKAEKGLSVEDKEREKAMIARLSVKVPPAYRPYYEQFLKSAVSVSKQYQNAQIQAAKSCQNAGGSVSSMVVSLGQQSYPVYIGRHSLADIGSYCSLQRRVLIVTDSGVPELYVRQVQNACLAPVVVTVPMGEASKSPERWLALLQVMADNRFDRHDCVVSVGGGVVGDLGGFAASAYMRGMDFYQVPTTLLAQVDSSVGGKTAIDLKGFKNIVGAFWQPSAVLIDPDVLETLDKRQFLCGMAEIIKVCATHDAVTFEELEKNVQKLPDDKDFLQLLIQRALDIKRRVVEADEKEINLRRVLNFGHTVGHAVETVGYQTESPLLHGECVGIGMLCVTEGAVRERIRRLLTTLGLPTAYCCSEAALRAALAHDKKNDGQTVHVVRVPEIGQFTLETSSQDELIAQSREVLTVI